MSKRRHRLPVYMPVFTVTVTFDDGRVRTELVSAKTAEAAVRLVKKGGAQGAKSVFARVAA